jgi:hypothetical protein
VDTFKALCGLLHSLSAFCRLEPQDITTSTRALIDEAAASATKTTIWPFRTMKLFDMPQPMERFRPKSLGLYLMSGISGLTFRLRLSGPKQAALVAKAKAAQPMKTNRAASA